jgi:hypothetical protein
MATTPLSLAFEDFLKAPIGNKSQKVATKSHFLPQKKGEGNQTAQITGVSETIIPFVKVPLRSHSQVLVWKIDTGCSMSQQ